MSLVDSAVILDAGQLRLTFIRRGDRWMHLVSRLNPVPEQPTLLISSLEGDAADRWPLSPALQSVHVEDRPRGKVAMLVGMAGDSHWSASVELDATRNCAVFDVACRAGSQPEFLGSTYERSNQGARLVPLEVAGSTTTFDTQESGWELLRVTPDDPVWPQTVRWRYTIEIG